MVYAHCIAPEDAAVLGDDRMRPDQLTLDIELSLTPEVLNHHPVRNCRCVSLTDLLQLLLLKRRVRLHDSITNVLHMTMGHLPRLANFSQGARQVKAGPKHTDCIPALPRCTSMTLLRSRPRPGEQVVRTSRAMKVMVQGLRDSPA